MHVGHIAVKLFYRAQQETNDMVALRDKWEGI